MSIFRVTVRRRGVSPLTQSMVVNARSREEAAGIATALAEGERGGMFEAGRVKSLGSVAPGVGVEAPARSVGRGEGAGVPCSAGRRLRVTRSPTRRHDERARRDGGRES